MSTHSLPWALATVVLALAVPASSRAAEERLVRLSTAETLRVTEAGEGEAVILVPGLFGSAFGFRLLVPRLAEAGYRAIVVEPLGVGGSSKPAGADYSLTSQADRIAQVLEALGIEQAVIVAHAVGASMAFRLAYRHPERVSAIVSLDGGPAEEAATPGFRRAMRFAPLLELFGGVRRIRGAVRKTLMARSADPRWVTEEVVDGYLAAGAKDLGATLTAYRGMARAREPQQLLPHLREVRCPVRLVVGAVPHEGGPSPAEVEQLREQLPSFVVDLVPGVAHFIYEEDPPAVVAAVNRARTSVRLSRALAAAPRGIRP